MLCESTLEREDADLHLDTTSKRKILSASGIGGCAWGSVDHCGDILNQLSSAIKEAAIDHFKCDIGIALVNPVHARFSGDDWEHHHSETIYEAGLEERATQANAANGG